jgi:hypothetical protein
LSLLVSFSTDVEAYQQEFILCQRFHFKGSLGELLSLDEILNTKAVPRIAIEVAMFLGVERDHIVIVFESLVSDVENLIFIRKPLKLLLRPFLG